MVPKEHGYLSALRNLGLGRPEGQVDKHVTGLSPGRSMPGFQYGEDQEFAYLVRGATSLRPGTLLLSEWI